MGSSRKQTEVKQEVREKRDEDFHKMLQFHTQSLLFFSERGENLEERSRGHEGVQAAGEGSQTSDPASDRRVAGHADL